MSHTPRTVAVTGLTGIVGRYVAGRLFKEGCRVRGLARAGSDRSGFAQSPIWITGDLQDSASLTELVESADTLIHCALEHASGRYRGGEAGQPTNFWRRNLIGTVELLEAASRGQVKRVVLLSSRAVFGAAPDGNTADYVDDGAPTSPDSHYGALKAAIEALGRQYALTTELCVASIRPTGVYGLGHPNHPNKWADHIAAACAGEPISQVRTATEVHGDDLADAIWRLLCAERAEVNGRIFNCSDVCLSIRELAERLARITGSTAPLPDEGTPPTNQMVSSGLKKLSWQPGGMALLNKTLNELVAAHQSNR